MNKEEQATVIRERFLDDEAPRIKSKYIMSIPDKFTGKTWVYEIVSKSSYLTLGIVKWHGPWRQYWFEPEPETGFNYTCGTEIFGFVKALMDERRDIRRQM